MDLLGTHRVDPVHQSPQTRAYGFFAKGTVPTSLLFTHLAPFLFPTIFAACLPRPTLVAVCTVAWLSPRFLGVGSEEVHKVALVLTSVRLSHCTCRFPACSVHEDSLTGECRERRKLRISAVAVASRLCWVRLSPNHLSPVGRGSVSNPLLLVRPSGPF